MKILVCGSIFGDFVKLKEIVDNLASKGKHFDLLLCCGQTLSINDLKLPGKAENRGAVLMPCDTFFVDSSEMA